MDRRSIIVAAGALAVAALGAAALAQAPEAPRGYLAAGQVPAAIDFVAPPPAEGSPQAVADRQTYLNTRALKDGPRWTQAQEDIDIDPSRAARLFDCTLGARLSQPQPPALTRLLTRVLLDVSASYNPAKAVFKRPRPPVGNDAPICEVAPDRMAKSYSYPSGHGSIGWAWALVLAEAEPDRAAALLRRGGAIGDSRVVCGAHFPSDIAAGRMVGAAVVAAEHGSSEFQTDLRAAKAEIDTLRQRGGENPACAAEAAALARPPF